MRSSSRYRHPGDAIHLIGSIVLLLAAVVVTAVTSDRLLGVDATSIRGVTPSTSAGRLLVGLVQLVVVVVVVAVLFAVLRRRRYRLLGSLALGAALAALVLKGIELFFDREQPAALVANLARGGWFASAAFPSPLVLAGAVAVAVIVTRWLKMSWKRATWIALALLAAARLISGTVLPMQLVLAFAVGVTVGTGLLVAFGAPDHRPGPADVAAALEAGGFPVVSATLAAIVGKGSRPFVVTNAGGERFFVKVLGQDQRDADLLYRAYRSIRLRDVGDVRPAASLKQAVEHQALVGVMAERAGVHTPQIQRILDGPDDSVMLVMDFVDGSSLADLSDEQLTDELLLQLWREVDRLHSVGIAHRSLRTANVMVDTEARPSIVDFSFSEVAAGPRAVELDVAELLASLATRVGPERAVNSALPVLGAPAVGHGMNLLTVDSRSRCRRARVGPCHAATSCWRARAPPHRSPVVCPRSWRPYVGCGPGRSS